MGSSESSPLEDELTGYKIIHKTPQNNITHLSHIETDKQYLLRQLTYNDQKLFRKHLEEHKSRQSITDDHLIHLGRVEGKQIDHLCSNLYKIYAIWEYPYRFLSDEINERSYQNRKFQDKQISSILASSIFALSTLQKNKIKHEMLTTRAILLDSEGLIKIADPLACGSSTNFDTVHRNRHCSDIYISPEQCQALELRGAYTNPYKSDVWVLGLIILECGLLENMSRCYKDQFQRIDFDMINTKLTQFGYEYGEQLKLVVQQMLKQDNKDRPDWIDLAQYARKFKSPFVEPTSKFNSGNKQSNDLSNYKSSLSPNSNQDQSSYYFNQFTNQNPISHVLRPSVDPPKVSLPQPRTNSIHYTQISNSTRPPAMMGPTQFNGLTHTSPQYTYGKDQQTQPISSGYINSQSGLYPSSGVSVSQNYSIPRYEAHLGGIPYSQNYTPLPEHSSSLYSARQGNLFPPPPSSGQPQTKDEIWKAQSLNYSIRSENYPEIYKDLSKPATKGFEPKSDASLSGYYKLDHLTQVRKNQAKFNNVGPNLQQPPASRPYYGAFPIASNSPYSTAKYPSTLPPSGNQSLFTPPSFLQSLNYSLSSNRLSGQESRAPFLLQNMDRNQKVEVKVKGIGDSGESERRDQINGNKDEGRVQDDVKIAAIIHNNQSLEQHMHTVESNNQNTYVDLIQREEYKSEAIAKDESYSNDKPQFVVETFKQGSKYEGYKLKDMRHGQGKFYYQDGGMYDGEWKRNKMDGFGSLYYQSGQLAYQGMWKDDQFQGKGKLFNQYPYLLQSPFDFENFDQIDEYWSYYEGDFVEDFKKGNGVLMLSNGEYIEGQFNNDMLDGPGIFHCKDGKLIKGVWRQNHLVSK